MNQIDRIHYVAVDKLVAAAFNPPARTNAKSIADLKASIEKYGILQPLAITKEFGVIDGHRRLECAKFLKFVSVPCIIQDSLGQAEGFCEMNGFTKQITRKDDLSVYVCGGPMTGRSKRAIVAIERIAGMECLERMVGQQLSATDIYHAIGITLMYVGKQDPTWTSGQNEYALKVIDWLVDLKQSWSVRRAITNRLSPNVLMSYITNKEPLP